MMKIKTLICCTYTDKDIVILYVSAQLQYRVCFIIFISFTIEHY